MVATGDEINAADITDLEDLTIRRPLVRLVQSVAQSVPDNTSTALTFTTDDIDTHGFHDTAVNTTRITPTVAGYYEFRGSYFSAAPTTLVSLDCSLRKSGVSSLPPGNRSNAGALAQSETTVAFVTMNGTTDYMELMALQDSAGATNTNVSLRFSSVFECIYVRAL